MQGGRVDLRERERPSGHRSRQARKFLSEVPAPLSPGTLGAKGRMINKASLFHNHIQGAADDKLPNVHGGRSKEESTRKEAGGDCVERCFHFFAVRGMVRSTILSGAIIGCFADAVALIREREHMNTAIKKGLAGLGGLLLIAAAVLAWNVLRPNGLAEGFAAGNGRIEAVEIDIAAKGAGRIKEILVGEGDFVTHGQILARMDTQQLEAQRREAEAQLQQTGYAVDTAKSQVAQRLSEKNAAQAVLAQRRAELEAARKRLERFEVLSRRGATSVQDLDDNRAKFLSGQAAVSAAEAQIAAAEAAVITAKSQLLGSQSAVQAVQATIERLQADIDDGVLKAPTAGRIQYRVAQPGEVLAGGGKVLNLLDLSDVYMTFFLPTEKAGKLGLGSEVRLVLDAAPQFVIPARISYVADVAQFTPKTVETASERQKLMFRVKARIDPELLKTYITHVKTGLPGMAYVRLDQSIDWPAHLRVNLPSLPQTTAAQP